MISAPEAETRLGFPEKRARYSIGGSNSLRWLFSGSGGFFQCLTPPNIVFSRRTLFFGKKHCLKRATTLFFGFKHCLSRKNNEKQKKQCFKGPERISSARMA